MSRDERRGLARTRACGCAIAVVLLALASLAGCGSSDRRADADETVARASKRALAMLPAHTWWAPNGDTANQRWVDGPIDSSSVSQLRVAWAVPLTARYAATPVVSRGVLYTQDLQSNVQAIDVRSGRVLWTTYYEETDIGPNGVNVVGQRVFGATYTHAFALDARTGRELWSRQISAHEGDAIDMAPGYSDGTVYVSTAVQAAGAVGTLWALDAASGCLRFVLLRTTASV